MNLKTQAPAVETRQGFCSVCRFMGIKWLGNGGIGVDINRYGKRIQHGLAGMLEIPRDIVFDLPKVTLLGNIQLYIENHRGIIGYAPECVRICVSTGELEVTGQELVIRSITKEEIYLEGIIQGLRCNT